VVSFGLPGLTFELAERSVDLVDDVVEAQEVLAGVFELEFRFVLADLVSGDPGGLFDQGAAIGRAGGEDLSDPSLLDDGVVAGSQPQRKQLVDDVPKPGDAAVHPVFRGAAAEDPSADFHPALVFGPPIIVRAKNHRYLGRARRFAARRSGEDDVAHVLQPQQGGALLAENPQHRVDDERT